MLITDVVYITGFALAYRMLRPLSWKLFRVTHRNNPEALAFANRMTAGGE